MAKRTEVTCRICKSFFHSTNKHWDSLENNISEEESSHTDWEYLENILEWLEDYQCLTKVGKEFRKKIWKKYVKSKGRDTTKGDGRNGDCNK